MRSAIGLAALLASKAGPSSVDGFRVTGGSRSRVPEFGALGGGFFVSGGAPTLANNLIEDNNTRPASPPIDDEPVGGGIDSEDAAITMRDNVVRNNRSGRGAGIAINMGEVVIRGNTVQGNIGDSDHGGGLYIASPRAEVTHNRIVGNEIGRQLGYGWAGGLVVYGNGTFATLSVNVVTGNYAPGVGAGVFIDDGAKAVLEHELIYANACTAAGGVGIYVDGYGDLGSELTLVHSTVAGHDCDTTQGGNGLYVESNSRVTINSSIFWGNGGDDFIVDDSSRIAATYTTSEEPLPGTGNLSSDPLFADALNHDYHLRSTTGRWDPAANGGLGGWVQDATHSPAIDAGDPALGSADEPAPNGGRSNQGVYADTAEASKSRVGPAMRSGIGRGSASDHTAGSIRSPSSTTIPSRL
jgi:hypothetical protein